MVITRLPESSVHKHVTYKHEISRRRSCMNAWLTAKHQTRRSWLARLKHHIIHWQGWRVMNFVTHLISYVKTVRWWSWWCSLSYRLFRSVTWSEQGANTRIEGISCPVEHCLFMFARHYHGEYTITNSLLIETSKKNIKMCSQSLSNPLSNPYFQSSPILYLLSPQLFTNP